MTRLIPLLSFLLIALALRGIAPTVIRFVHTFPTWQWTNAGWMTLFFIFALATASCYALVWLLRVRDALQRRRQP